MPSGGVRWYRRGHGLRIRRSQVRSLSAYHYAADSYDKVITDPKTSTVLKERHEPLSEHRGHGSARRPSGPTR